MAQASRKLTAITEDKGQFPVARWYLKLNTKSSLIGSDALYWALQTLHIFSIDVFKIYMEK